MSAPAKAFARRSHAPSPHGPVRDWRFVGGIERSHDPEKVRALTQAISPYYDDALCGFSLLCLAAGPVLRGGRPINGAELSGVSSGRSESIMRVTDVSAPFSKRQQ